MIDTVTFNLPGVQPPEHLILNDEMAHSFKPLGNGRQWFFYNTNILGPFETSIRITYYPQDVSGKPISMSTVQCSLPNLVYGDNVSMLMNTELAVLRLNLIVNDFFETKIELNEAELGRIDLCYNHYLEGFVHSAIAALFKLSYPKRKTKPYYPTSGVQYFSKHATLTFYSKEEESGIAAARNILREEASYITKYAVRNAMGVKKPVLLRDFTAEVVEKILRRENQILGLDESLLVDKFSALRSLMLKYGSEQGMRLFGFLNAQDLGTRKELIELGIAPRTLSRSNKDIKDLGIWSAFADKDLKMPPLSINLKTDGDLGFPTHGPM